ncbi:RNA pseudouridine synthase 7 isoform X3 [Salvia miltiorrhiza]|uniref:RNA pseudouridine synthase 7 isoform X3 n=1 Tax=Salvia miltiorrhiza TaxID=226208 RepID=UPI0025AC4757|nr:RNA pseudouridine synthase 7 isoform X3 [Salvia miltiorrhiza]
MKGGMKRKRSQPDETMDIVWQTPANPPHRQDYIFRDGVRYVRPYYFEFISHAKNRWAGKTIVDLFTDEFKGRPRDYYVSAVKTGRIQVDGQKVPISYVVQPSQKISHFLHRHEPPVMAMDIQILHTEPDVVTVYKPATTPVHPCGQYRKNTVVGILEAEHDLAPLFPIHRLDRLVSGLLIIARSASKADIFRQQIESGEVKKQYIARVTGVFPEDEQVADVNVNYNAREGRSTVEVENGPTEKNSVKGKAACTKFTRVSTNGTESIVLCEPITGRTHQIRVHLQYLGHPIANDSLYLSESVPSRSLEGLGADRAAANSGLAPKVMHCEINESGSADEPAEDFNIDPMCTNCPDLPPKGYDVHEAALWLHCIRYSGPDWTYECPYPKWASLTGFGGDKIVDYRGG